MTLGVGFIGFGSIAKRRALGAIFEVAGLELVCIASRSGTPIPEGIGDFCVDYTTDYDELINRSDIDLVYISTHPATHFELVMKSLNNNKHVLVEKPAFLSSRQARKAIETALTKGLLILENFGFLHHQQQLVIADLIDEEIGQVRLIKSSFGFPPIDPNDFRYRQEFGGGSLNDAGVYPLRQLCALYPSAQPSVEAATLFESDAGVDVSGVVSMLVPRNDGQLIPAQISFGFDHFYQNNLEVWGSKGYLKVDRIFSMPRGVEGEAFLETVKGKEVIRLPSDDNFVKIFKHAESSIRSCMFSNSYDSILKQTECLDRIKIAAKTFAI